MVIATTKVGKVLLRKLDTKLRAVDLVIITMVDGKVTFEPAEGQTQKEAAGWIETLRKGVRNPATGEKAKPSDGEAFLQLLPFHFWGVYLWAEEV